MTARYRFLPCDEAREVAMATLQHTGPLVGAVAIEPRSPTYVLLPEGARCVDIQGRWDVDLTASGFASADSRSTTEILAGRVSALLALADGILLVDLPTYTSPKQDAGPRAVWRDGRAYARVDAASSGEVAREIGRGIFWYSAGVVLALDGRCLAAFVGLFDQTSYAVIVHPDYVATQYHQELVDVAWCAR